MTDFAPEKVQAKPEHTSANVNPASTGIERRTYLPAEAATVIGIGRNSVYALIRSGRLRSIQLGRKILIPHSAVDEFLAGPTSN